MCVYRYFQHMFHTKLQAYVSALTAKTRPSKVKRDPETDLLRTKRDLETDLLRSKGDLETNL